VVRAGRHAVHRGRRTLNYEKKTGGTSKKVSGKISGFKGDDVEVFALVTVTLNVQRPPHLDGGEWKMTVEGDELTRKAGNAEKRADHLEADIQRDLAGKGVIIRSIDCPPTHSAVFDCKLKTGAGDDITVHCEDDGKGNIEWKADVAVLSSDKIETFIEDTYEKQLKKRVKATCPPGTLLKHPGDVFTCTAKPKVGGKTDTVTVTVKNTAGDISIKS
jgi:hypothetical protein